MDDTLRSLLRPELAELTAYAPAVPTGIDVRLDANEAPPTRSPAVREAVARALAAVPLERYPDARASRLKEALARRTGARPDELLLGTGSDEVIGLILTALGRPRGKSAPTVVVPNPTFVMYRVTARVQGMKPIEVPLDATWDLDVGSMRRALEFAKPNVVFVATPNNPTGNAMSEDRVVAVLDAAKESFVVLDEAYVEYAPASVRGLREGRENVGVLRTLSKVGLAALRVGWLEADAELVREIDKARQPFNVSATSQAAAAAVLEDAWDAVRAEVEETVAERERVAAEVVAMGAEVTPRAANFLWVRTGERAAREVWAALVSRGVLVRGFDQSGGRLARQLRVTIGTPQQNDRFLAALREALA